mmetsp:Transcript_11375/g.42703  ORF Transcript_11375/g.42703 Transcript_11375/m.42703 type:complete len:113 (-) Transcript_11375:279-617(-)|eukprot:CAMPEP_0117448276 /NCGR_PEP_ID=MMETSP0759-20121206/7316_1 /TAXON_ID=63605 /ORGANISM="Percolomonas cosmopolitus, Strain WS" /LENGTH=112 /DNA_ID=CAMNT_0005240655 /DNA_START=39 /DNA_END=377 /DNA_ORIENTATION=+
MTYQERPPTPFPTPEQLSMFSSATPTSFASTAFPLPSASEGQRLHNSGQNRYLTRPETRVGSRHSTVPYHLPQGRSGSAPNTLSETGNNFSEESSDSSDTQTASRNHSEMKL